MRPRQPVRPVSAPVDALDVTQAAAVWRAIATPAFRLEPEKFASWGIWNERDLNKLAANRLRRLLERLAAGKSPSNALVPGWRETLEDAGLLEVQQ